MNLTTLVRELNATFLLSVAAFLLAMALTPLYTYFAYRYKFWKKQRAASTTGEELTVFTKLHADKFTRNIPTMAGMIGIVAIAVVTLGFNLDRAQTWLPLAALLGGGAVGLLDDVININSDGSGSAGLRAWLKFSMIAAMAAVLAWFFYVKLGYTTVHVPYFGDWQLGPWIVPLFVFAVVATGNAVNISDGLDGLAGGLLALSYLWFNIYPARFFMGDVGSFAFGTSLGVVAMLTNTLFLLPVIGVLFVVEAGSSLIQILSKKFFHRKVFISAPIHQHFQAVGWPEVKVTMRFWVISCVTGFIGLMMALGGGHI